MFLHDEIPGPCFWSFTSNSKSEQFSRFPVSLAGLLQSRGISTVWLKTGFAEALQKQKAQLPASATLQAKKIVKLYENVPQQCLTAQKALLEECQPVNADRDHIVFDLAASLSEQAFDLFLCSDQRICCSHADPAALEQTALFLNKCFFRLVELEFAQDGEEWQRCKNVIEPTKALPELSLLSFFDSDRLRRIRQRLDDLTVHLLLLRFADEKENQAVTQKFIKEQQSVYTALRIHGPWRLDPSFAAWFSALDKYFNQTDGHRAVQILEETDQRFARLHNLGEKKQGLRQNEQDSNRRAYTMIHNQLIFNLEFAEVE